MIAGKKLLSTFMSFVLAFTLTPLPAWAESGRAAAQQQEPSSTGGLAAAAVSSLSESSDESQPAGIVADPDSSADAEVAASGESSQFTPSDRFSLLAQGQTFDEPCDEISVGELQPEGSLTAQGGDEPLSYEDATTHIVYQYVVESNEAHITKVVSPSETGAFNVAFPKSIDGKSVTQLGEGASDKLVFEHPSTITGLTIPNTVKDVYLYSFQGYDKLSTVSFETGSAIQTLPEQFFAYGYVRDVTLPDSLTEIGEGAFYRSNLMNLAIPASVTSIGKNAFSWCFLLEYIEVPATVQAIGETAFASCERLRTVDLAGVKTVGEGAFEGCVQLVDLTMGEGLEAIGDYAFFNCAAIGAIEFPNTLKTIGAGAFSAGSSRANAGEYNLSYTSISIPDSVTSIGEYAFVNNLLANLQLGTSQANSHLQTLGSCAFALASITDITLPNSLTSLGNVAEPAVDAETGMVHANGAFRGCLALSTVVWPTTSSMSSVGGFDSCTSLPDSVLSDLPAYFTSIAPGAFADCAFEELSIPSTITSIGDYAFALSTEADDALESIVIDEDGDDLSIGKRAFAKERNGGAEENLKLSLVELPERVSSIGAGAFAGIVTKTEVKQTSKGVSYQVYEGPAFEIRNPDVTLGNGSAFGAEGNEWPFSPAEGVTIRYPSGASAPSILAFRSAVESHEADLSSRCQNSSDPLYGTTFNPTVFETTSFVPNHKISGTVPAGAKVELIADGVSEKVTVAEDGTFKVRKPEGTAVSATVTVAGYKVKELSPSFAVASKTITDREGNQVTISTTDLLVQDWSFTVTTSDLVALSKYTISGNVPAGATVDLLIGDDTESATVSSAGGIASRQVVEGTIVGAVVRLDGYEPLYISPDEGKSRALLNANWAINVTGAMMTPLSNLGSLQVKVKKGLSGEAETAAVNGCNVAVFNSGGALMAQGAVPETGLFVAESLPAGAYTVVGFDSNKYFSTVSSPDDFASLGLDDSDYAKATVVVQARNANELELLVPNMDKDKLAGPVAARSVYLTTDHVVPTCVFYARVSYQMNEGNEADSLTVKVPNGVSVVTARTANKRYWESGAAADSSVTFSAGALTLSGLAEEDKSGATLYLGLSVTTAGSYNISASLTSNTTVVPLGSADIDAPALALQAPTGALPSTTFPVVVYAQPESVVSFIIGSTDLAETVTTNKLGYARANLTIPENELDYYSYYLLKASTSGGATAQAVLNYEYTTEQATADIMQLFFHHGGKDVYLVKDGQDVAGGFYNCIVSPSQHEDLYSPTWPFTAVIDSARPLENTVTLQMEMLDSTMRYETMNLSRTQDLHDAAGTKRYTYTADVLVGSGRITDNLKSSEIPRSFDILFTYDPNTAVATPSQSVLETMKARSSRTYAAWTADLRSMSYSMTGNQLGELTPERRADIEDLLFNGGYRHENWMKEDSGDLVWLVLFDDEDRAKYLEYEEAMDKLVSDLGTSLGGKSLDQYGNAKSFLADVAGYKEGQFATPSELEQQGYTVIYDNNAASWQANGYHAPSWYAIKSADSASTQSAEPMEGVATQEGSGGSGYQEHYSYYRDSLGYQIGGITHDATNTPLDLGQAALDTSRASIAVGGMDVLSEIVNDAEVSKMKEGATWLVNQNMEGVLSEAEMSYMFKRDFGKELNSEQIERIAKGNLIPESDLASKIDKVAGPIGDMLTVTGTVAGIGGVAQSSGRLQGIEDQRAALNGEMDRIELQLQALRRNGELTTPLGLAYLQELNALTQYRAMLDDDNAVYTYDSLYGSLTTLGGATEAGGEASWLVSEGWDHMKNNSEYQAQQRREQIRMDYERARLARIREENIAADAKKQREKLRYALQPIMDPSGYVYAGVDGNRLSGVVATIYQRVANVMANAPWLASQYNQENGQTTGEGGIFGWDVPEGSWVVKFELDGYDTYITDPLDTPPEITNLAINLLASNAKVGSVTRDGNTIVVTFQQYMKLSDAPTVTVNGVEVAGTWTDAEEGLNSVGAPELMGKTLRVPISGGARAGATYNVGVAGGTSYAGKELTAFSAQVKVPAAPVTYQTMHRLYNPNSGEHFYTASASERDMLRGVGWAYEGEGWKAPKTGANVYRLYNANAGDHHYTTSAAERDYLVRVGWSYEGVGWKSGGSKPLYRQYNPNAVAGAHNYTTSKAENDFLVRVGWRAEGIGWYGV